MYLKSLTLKGFKSFPDRTRLDFGPGVSVVVGPNGSGKSNVTDAVLWAMGEQSPLAVRGQSMQDVIFGGGHGVQPRSSAEVEIVLDNSDGTVELPLSEISIVRRLDRTGEGQYRLNGTRCRLGDVVEALSDTGLGKETHSVISQGRVEAIVTSRPRDRRLLIEEAAGLGKHRKRRRRAQLKLERTQENLDRALDVEREARTRLRPLKRQAEAAQLNERLERQIQQVRLELVRDEVRLRSAEMEQARASAAEARGRSAELSSALQATIDRRLAAERALAERSRLHEQLTSRVFAARGALERLLLREEQVRAGAEALARRIQWAERESAGMLQAGDATHAAGDTASAEQRLAALTAELSETQARLARGLEEQLKELAVESDAARAGAEAAEEDLQRARQARARADEMVEQARAGSVWSETWKDVRRVIGEGVRRLLSQRDERERLAGVERVAAEAEEVARGVVEYALKGVRAAEDSREQAEVALREAERHLVEAREAQHRSEWLIEQRRSAAEGGPLAVRRAELEGEIAAVRERLERMAGASARRRARAEELGAMQASDGILRERAQRLLAVIDCAREAIAASSRALEAELEGGRSAGEQMASELRACAGEEAELQRALREAGELVTEAEVKAQRVHDQLQEAQQELGAIAERLGAEEPELDAARAEALGEEQIAELQARVERLERRRAQLGPVNPLARQEHEQAVAHVEELEGRRADLETAMRELRALIADTDRQIERTFQRTFAAAAENFSELVDEVFPGGTGKLRLVGEERAPRPVLGGQPLSATTRNGDEEDREEARAEAAAEDEAEAELARREQEELLGVEIELTPAGKSTKRLSLLSGGEKSMTALAFLFAVFLARPCPFYILDEVEAALDDLNLDRFLGLLRRYADRAQFIVITHQKRTMEAADWLYGVSMGSDGVSKILSRRLPADAGAPAEVAEVA
jgi:chromosome segregation protein